MILKLGRGEHRKYAPLAFTEHGAIMAASILNSAREVTALKSRVDTLDTETRKQFDQVFEAILGLSGPARGRQ